MEPLRKDLILKGTYIYLRPICVEDTERVVRWRNDRNVVKNFIDRTPLSQEIHLDWLNNKVQKGCVHQFVVCRNIDKMPLGSVYLQNFEEKNKKAEEGIFLGEEQAYGKGVGTEAAKLMLNYAFEYLKLHKVLARVLAYNQASLRMHQKAGYVQEAYFKDELFLDGKYEDLVFFGAINPLDK
ncbi:putative ribosomal N-acetyltransferase YdaF [Lachnospiraceae bacterium]|nr:putative ribosomal N-acetyltransferase YdaF [Lachnospiraceae bacterium]